MKSAQTSLVSVEPLERGYGDTLITPSRRVFLEGAAVEAIQIDMFYWLLRLPCLCGRIDIVLNVAGLVFRNTNNNSDEAEASASLLRVLQSLVLILMSCAGYELVNPVSTLKNSLLRELIFP